MRHLLPLALLVASPTTASSESIPILNHGFEAPAIPAGTFSTTAPPPGWSGYGDLDFGLRTIGVLHPATTSLYAVEPPEGNNVGVVFLLDDFGDQTFFADQEAGLQQTLTATLQADTRYTLRVHVGNIAVDPNPPHDPWSFDGFPGYRVDLMAGGQILASDDDSLLPAEGQFAESTVQVDIDATHPQLGQPLAIRLVNRNAAVGIEVNFDDVRLDATDLSPWTDLGQSKPGVQGLPTLSGSGPLTVGSANQVSLGHAAPASTAILFFGLTAIDAPLLGGTFVPSPQVAIALTTNASGAATLPFVWPAGVPGGTTLYFQGWVDDPAATFGAAASNGLLGVSP